MSTRSVEFVVPGDLQTATGGYGYDRRMIAGLRALGWQVTVHALDADFPHPGAAALERAHGVLAALPDEALVLIDGLGLGAMPHVVQAHAARLHLLALIHHPLAAESGLEPAVARRLFGSERQALQAVRHVLVTSHATARALRAYGVNAAKISVVEPGTDEAPLARGRRAAGDGEGTRGSNGSNGSSGSSGSSGEGDGGDTLQLLCVGTVIPRKGHEVLIEALASLAAQPWHLTCAGSLSRSPVTVERLSSQLHRAGVAGRVRLLGEVSAPALERLYLEADLFVLPSRLEGYGMAVAEALAHGLPVIGTHTGAIAELVGTGAGLLVEPGDAQALRVALERVLREPGLLDRLRRGAEAVRHGLPRWGETCARMSGVLERAATGTLQHPLHHRG